MKTRSERLDAGELIDCGPVVEEAKATFTMLAGLNTNSLCFDWGMFERRLSGPFPPGSTAYDETVRLLVMFMEAARAKTGRSVFRLTADDEHTGARAGSDLLVFTHHRQVPDKSVEVLSPSGPVNPVWRRESWTCYVVAHTEGGMKCLTFTDNPIDRKEVRV